MRGIIVFILVINVVIGAGLVYIIDSALKPAIEKQHSQIEQLVKY